MRYRSYLAMLFISLLICMSTEVRAAESRMIFWYPGEAGSTEEAQPVLDLFLDYVHDKMGAKGLEGRYFNTVDAGKAYLAKQKPKVGIVSFAAWKEHPELFSGSRVLLATLPLPDGTPTQRYTLVSLSGTVPAGSTVLSSEPLTKAFVQQHLFSALPSDLSFTHTPQLFAKLKRMASGELQAAAILTPLEAKTISQLTAPWARALKVVAQSTPVATARVVLFDASWKPAQKFKEVLLKARSDADAQEILTEMRLVGFAEVPEEGTPSSQR